MIADPEMIVIMTEGRKRERDKAWKLSEQLFYTLLEQLPDFEA